MCRSTSIASIDIIDSIDKGIGAVAPSPGGGLSCQTAIYTDAREAHRAGPGVRDHMVVDRAPKGRRDRVTMWSSWPGEP